MTNSATAQSVTSAGAVLEPWELIEIFAGRPVVLLAIEEFKVPLDRSELLLPPVSH